MIILIGGEKGGTGKTTVATNIAAIFAQQGKEVLLVDADKQASSASWAGVRGEKSLPRVPCIQSLGKGAGREIKSLSEKYENIIVDGGGRDSVELRAALTVADLFIIPTQASQFDVWTLNHIDELVEHVLPINPNLKTSIIINRASTNINGMEVVEAESLFSDFENLKFSGIVLRDRISFRRAASEGMSVIEETKKRDPKAIFEIEELFEGIKEYEVETAIA